jgi:hypothetical protein
MGRNCHGWQEHKIHGTSVRGALSTWYLQEAYVPATVYRFLDAASVVDGNPTCPLPGPYPTLGFMAGKAAEQVGVS